MGQATVPFKQTRIKLVLKELEKNTFIKRGRIDFSVLKTHADLFIFRDGELVMIREH